MNRAVVYLSQGRDLPARHSVAAACHRWGANLIVVKKFTLNDFVHTSPLYLCDTVTDYREAVQLHDDVIISEDAEWPLPRDVDMVMAPFNTEAILNTQACLNNYNFWLMEMGLPPVNNIMAREEMRSSAVMAYRPKWAKHHVFDTARNLFSRVNYGGKPDFLISALANRADPGQPFTPTVANVKEWIPNSEPPMEWDYLHCVASTKYEMSKIILD
jgi:hypothetical protein